MKHLVCYHYLGSQMSVCIRCSMIRLDPTCVSAVITIGESGVHISQKGLKSWGSKGRSNIKILCPSVNLTYMHCILLTDEVLIHQIRILYKPHIGCAGMGGTPALYLSIRVPKVYNTILLFQKRHGPLHYFFNTSSLNEG